MPSAFDTMMMNGENRQRRRQYNGNRYNEAGSIDDQIAQDFTKLSFHDRNAIYEEIHGVHNPAPDETPEMLANALHQLSLEIAAIPHKPAFDKSQQWNSLCNSFPTIDCTQSIYSYNKTTIAAGTHTTYVNTVDFRLRFLRCELFDAKKAAIRIVNYLEMIHDLYGGDEELLRRPIGLIDLKTREERDCLRSGFHQLLPFRDRSGRRVLAIVRAVLYVCFVLFVLESSRGGTAKSSQYSYERTSRVFPFSPILQVPNMDRKNFCIRLRVSGFLILSLSCFQ